MTIEEMTAKLAESAAAEPGGARTLKIDMSPDGVIRVTGAVVDNEDGPAACTVKVTKSDFEKIVAGDLNPTMAFMTGKLRVDGDVGVAMELQSLIGRAFG